MVAILAGMADVPGVTINRYCSSSLQAIRMAAHAIKAGEGDAFVAAGVETVSRFVNGMADDGPTNELFDDAEGPQRRSRRRRGRRVDRRPPVCPTSTWRMGQTAENVAEFENVSRQEMDEFAALSQQRADESVRRTASGRWRSRPVKLPDGTVVTGDDGIRAGTTVEGLEPAQARLQARRQGDRRQRLPAERRCRRGRRDERHARPRSSASPRWRAS